MGTAAALLWAYCTWLRVVLRTVWHGHVCEPRVIRSGVRSRCDVTFRWWRALRPHDAQPTKKAKRINLPTPVVIAVEDYAVYHRNDYVAKDSYVLHWPRPRNDIDYDVVDYDLQKEEMVGAMCRRFHSGTLPYRPTYRGRAGLVLQQAASVFAPGGVACGSSCATAAHVCGGDLWRCCVVRRRPWTGVVAQPPQVGAQCKRVEQAERRYARAPY